MFDYLIPLFIYKYLLLCIQCWDSWWWTVDLSETCRVLYQNTFDKYCNKHVEFFIKIHLINIAINMEQFWSHKGLSPCDFDLIPKMKEPLRGIRFRTVTEILQAVDRAIRTINTTGAAKGILRLPHRWQRLYTMLVTTVKDGKTSKHVSILYQL